MEPVSAVACALIYLATLCVGEPDVRAESRGGWPTTTLKLETSEWRAEVLAASDSPSKINPTLLVRACQAATCIDYHASCEDLDCLFVLDRPGEQPFQLRVMAESPKDLAEAEAVLGLLAPNGERFGLDALTQRSDRRFPYCQRIAPNADGPRWEAGCEFMGR